MRNALLIAILLLSACKHKPPPAPPLDSGDRVQALLRDRVGKQFTTGDDFQVLVTQVDYPIGTLMQEGRTVALTDTACTPAFDVHSYSLPNMFNSIAMTGKAAFDLGVDAAATQRLGKFGVKAGQDDVFNLSVSNAAGKFVLDDKLQDLLRQPDCAKFVQGKTLLLVRGYVIGKRAYLLQRGRNAGGEVSVDHVGDLKVDASRTNAISLTDEQPVEFLQIVSKIAIGPPPPPPPPPPPHPPGPGPGPTVNAVPPGTGPVYMQRDVADTSDNAAKVRSLLAGQSFAVPGIEAIAHDKMPSIAQVRYFNTSDEALAETAVAVLRKVYPTAAKLYVGLKAPKGQLEVWLPKAGG